MQAKIFPGLHKAMILGIPWLRKEYPHIDWTWENIVLQQGKDKIELPLTRQRLEEDPTVNLVSAN